LASDQLLFFAFAAISVLGSLAVISQKNPIYSVLALIGAFFGLSGLYVLLQAPFVAIVQIMLALLLVAELGWALMRTPGISDAIGAESAGVSNVGELGRVLFTDYMFAFEVTSILIIAAMVGAVILARKQTE
jgi:NADH-quinone oxidoreductase subunit J